MRAKNFVRAIIPAALLTFVALAGSMPASAQIAVGISVHVGPPALPVYAQPICPTEGYIWTPGFGAITRKADITGCREFGWRRREWACCGLRDIGAMRADCMDFMRDIGDRTWDFTAE